MEFRFDRDRIARPLVVLLLAGATMAADCDDDDDDMMGPDPTPQTFMQIDRFGLPAINTVFIPTAQKQTYNQSVPANDPANFEDEVRATLEAFGVTGDTQDLIATTVLPDRQPIDTSQPTAFLNGRAPSDDVIDGELTLIFGAGTPLSSDNVDANDVPFLSAFPYLAPPN
ncbi:MAG TPA: DUF4331 family protein [Gemmatimonadota bacterium]|nr:DUF4331 family protein [Gemmatimonadota bacterium]